MHYFHHGLGPYACRCRQVHAATGAKAIQVHKYHSVPGPNPLYMPLTQVRIQATLKILENSHQGLAQFKFFLRSHCVSTRQ
jgi:hypothetical protein